MRTGELAVLESQRQLKELQSQVVDVHSEIAQTKTDSVFAISAAKCAPTNGTIFQLSIENAGVFSNLADDYSDCTQEQPSCSGTDAKRVV